jgi:hypothetical protein
MLVLMGILKIIQVFHAAFDSPMMLSNSIRQTRFKIIDEAVEKLLISTFILYV